MLFRGLSPAFGPDDEGAGGGTQAGAEGATGGDGGGEGDKALLAFAAGGTEGGEGEKAGGDEGEKGKATEPYRPDGLPDNLIGKDDRATIDAMAKALKGFQKEASRKGVPSDPAGYKLEPAGDDDAVGQALASERMAPTIDRARAAAHAAGLGQDQFDKFVREFAGADGDVSWMLPDEEAMEISGREQYQALVRDMGGEDKANAVLGHVVQHWNQWVKSGLFTGEINGKAVDPDSDAYEFQQMIGTARGARIMSKIVAAYTAQDPVPTLSTSERDNEAALFEEQKAVMAMPAGDERDKAFAALERRFAALYKD